MSPITPTVGMVGSEGVFRELPATTARGSLMPVPAVKFLVVVMLLLCMSAPEQLFAPFDPDALNPFVGAMKLIVLILGGGLVLICRSGRSLMPIAKPFGLFISWAIVCWLVSGAESLPMRNLVSSFGGIVILAGLGGALEFVGGIRGLVRLMVWALVLVAILSVLLGLIGLQAMPGEIALAGQLELFHGIGMPAYAIAACACLIAWVLGRQLADPSARSVGPILLLLILPMLSFYRAFLIGIIATVIAAALGNLWQNRGNGGRRSGRSTKGLVLLALLSLVAGTIIFSMKTATREEGNELSGREIIWPIEVASVIQHPWFGLGPFGDIQLLFFDERMPQVGAAHSEYLAAAVCYGMPGLLLFIATLVSLWRGVRQYSVSTLEQQACRNAAFLILIALSVTIIAENVIRDPRLFTLYLLFPALCLSGHGTGRQAIVQ
jgi:O-antigen ligase